MQGRRENRLQTAINTIGFARHGSLTCLARWVSANWMRRFSLEGAVCGAALRETHRGLMGTDTPILPAQHPNSPLMIIIITPQENTTSPTTTTCPRINNKTDKQAVMCSRNAQNRRCRFKCLSLQMSQLSLFMGINFP